MDQKVAVIIPTYNGSALLPETLDSILSQTLPAAEIIVVDDGSPEGLDECISVYERKGVRFIRTPNRGVSAARNTGAESTTSPWLAFLDHDDIWLPHKLKREMDLLRQVPDCRYCISDFRSFSVTGFAQQSHFELAPLRYWEGGRHDYGTAGFVLERNMFEDYLTFYPTLPSTSLIGRELYEEIGGWNPETSRYRAQDFEFHLLCANHPPVAVVPEVLVHYRRHPGNWSDDQLLQAFGCVEIVEYMLSKYELGRQHEGSLRKALELKTRDCADRAFYDRRLTLFHQYLIRLPLRRRTARLIARDVLTHALPERVVTALGRSIRMLKNRFSA